MATETTATDNEALVELLTAGKPLDAEAYRRLREHGERVTERLREEHGEMNLASDLIRAVRDEA